MVEKHFSNNYLKDTIEDLKLFEQTIYCYNYIKNKYPTLDKDNLEEQADIASACFRQANEYIKSAKIAPLSTNPLLYSYALNNFSKGMAYLLFIDETILSNFNDHGFKVLNENIGESILETKVTIKKFGVINFLLKTYNNYELEKQNISFEKLLSQIPGLEKIFLNTTGKMGNVLRKIDGKSNDFFADCLNTEDIAEKRKICDEYGLVGDYSKGKIYASFNAKGSNKYNGNDVIKRNLFYKNYLIIPNEFVDGIHDINLIFYCYLIIMGYGMLVRYNAHKWEKFIDCKLSNEATLIQSSIECCVNNFIILLHQKIFEFYYLEDKYNDLDVRRVIDDSTVRIMNNISNNIFDRNMRYNSKEPFPWPRNLRN